MLPPLIGPFPVASDGRSFAQIKEATDGAGEIEWTRVGDRTVLTRLRAAAPLKLLAPRSRGEASAVYASTYGGGLLAGDSIDLRFNAGTGTTAILGSQASTKVYRSPEGIVSRQSVRGVVEAGALAMLMPDPLTCFAGAVFQQRQRIDLRPGASLLLLDWLTSGRRAVGERWDFTRYESRIEVWSDGRMIFRDATLLESQSEPIDPLSPHSVLRGRVREGAESRSPPPPRPSPGVPGEGEVFPSPLSVRGRMGRFNCLALLLLLGPRLRELSQMMLNELAAEPLRSNPHLFFVASPLADGAVIRMMATETESAGDWLRGRLNALPVARDFWARKH